MKAAVAVAGDTVATWGLLARGTPGQFRILARIGCHSGQALFSESQSNSIAPWFGVLQDIKDTPPKR